MGQIRYITISSEIYDGRLCYAKFLDNNNQTTDLGQQFLSFEFSTDADYGTCFVYVPSVDNTFVVNISEEICPTPTPTVTATVSPTPSITPSNTPTETPTSTPSETPTSTPTETPTNTPSETATQTPTNTETPTSTVTPTETETPTPTQTPTPTETPTPTVTQTPTPTETLTPTVTQTPTLTPFRNVIIQNNNSNGVDVASYASNFSQVFNFNFPIVYGETVNGFHYEIFSGDFITFGVTGGTEYVLNIFRNDELIDTISNSSPYFYVYSFNTGFTENDLLKLVVENTILPTPTNTVTPTSTETPTPTSTPAVPVTTNLAVYYDPSNPSSYSGSGTVLNDLSGNGLTGTLSNVTYTSPAFNFNGTSSTISVPDNVLLEPGSGDWTMEAWVNHTVIASSSRVILGKTDGGTSALWGYGLRTIANGNTYGEVGNGTTSITTNSSTLNINTWYQVVAVWTNVATNNFELFINGVSQGSQSHSFTSIRNTTRPLYIGSFDGGAVFGQWLNGKVGIVRLYNAALTPSQVTQNFNANRSIYGL